LLKRSLGGRELYERIRETIVESLGDRVKAIILFGSTVYLGRGRDIDLVVVVDKLNSISDKMRLEYSLSRRLCREQGICETDIHILDLDGLIENLQPGSFLSGLALGYEILYDMIGVEKYIIDFLERLSREKYVLHNRYGTWDLGFYARVLLRRKRNV